MWPLHSSTLIGRKGAANPSSLHTTLEGPTEYVKPRWRQSLHGFLHGIKWIKFHGHLDYFQKSPLGGRPNSKPGYHGTPEADIRWFILFYHAWGPAWIEIIEITFGWGYGHIWLHNYLTWRSVSTLHDFGGGWDGIWTLSFGLSQCHSHGSWLVCVWSGS